MLKKIVSILVTLAMLCGMCAVVTADAAEGVYDYLPSNITIVPIAGNPSSGISVAWKNPTSTSLSKVTVTDASGGTQVGVVESPTPGAVVSVQNESLTGYANKIFKAKFVFEFSDGQKRELYHTQDVRGLNSATNDVYTPLSVSVELKNSGITDVNYFTVNTDNTTENGKNCLMVVSNIPDGQTSSNIYFGNANSLTVGKTYKLSFKIKTDVDLQFWCGTINTTLNKIDANSEWQTFEQTITAKGNRLSLGFENLRTVFYLDDVTVTELDSDGNPVTGENSTSHTYDFEDLPSDAGSAAPTDVQAIGSDGMATINWKNGNYNKGYVNVYQVLDSGEKVLISRLGDMLNDIKDTSIDIKYLENGKKYKFSVSAMSRYGTETQATEVTVTPDKSVISKYEYEPSNIMITDWRNSKGSGAQRQGYKLSWINPTAEMTSVKLYEIKDDGTETEKTPNYVFEPVYRDAVSDDASDTYLKLPVTTPGAVVHYDEQPTTDAAGAAAYRLVFEFADGQTRNIIYSGKFQGTSTQYQLASVDGSQSVSVFMSGDEIGKELYESGNKNTIRSMFPANGMKIRTKPVTSGSNYALELTSNQADSWGRNDAGIKFSGDKLVKDSSYAYEMDVNTLQTAKLWIDKVNEVNIPNTNGEWKTINGTFKAVASDAQVTLTMMQATREMYVDNIKIFDSEGKTKIGEFSFSGANFKLPDAVTGVGAVQNDKNSAKISWDAASAYVNVYEDIDENDGDDVHTWMLRARVPGDKKSVILNNLETDMTHNFMVTTEQNYKVEEGLESDGVTCSAELVAPDYEIEDVYLYADNNPESKIEYLVPGSTYTAQAKIINSKLTAGLDARVIVAIYADGVLDNVYLSDQKNITVGNTETVTVGNVAIGNAAGKTYTAKIMVWKSLESVIPILKSTPVYGPNV